MYLSCEDEPEVVVHATKILSRLLVIHGSAYSKKFADKNGGYTILGNHLRRWWSIPVLWPICFALLFGRDIALLDLDRSFDVAGLLKLFLQDGDLRIVYPEMFPVIMGMLGSALRSKLLSGDGDKHLNNPKDLKMSQTSLNGELKRPPLI